MIMGLLPAIGGGAIPGMASGGFRVSMDPVTILLEMPGGGTQSIRFKPKLRFDGVAGVHVALTPEHHGAPHPAGRFKRDR